MSSESAVRVAGLGKSYEIYDHPRDWLRQKFAMGGTRYFREFWALKDLSIDVRRGEAVGIIGSNGSGKSTLLQLVCGIMKPTTGSVHASGRVAALLELGSGFNPDFTGRENVFMNGALLGLSAPEIEERFEDIASFAGIGAFMDQPTRTYSSGMVVRLAFAVSVCVDPDILVIDEALAVGDASFQFKCLTRLESLTARGTTLLLVSHDMSMIKRFCSRAIYLRQGQLRGSGLPDEAAELYLMDTRDDQRRWASGGTVPVKRKPSPHGADAMAFGTDEGRIVRAGFSAPGDLYCSYVHGEEIHIVVEATVCPTVRKPGITLTVQDQRLLVVSGQHFRLTPGPAHEGWHPAHLAVRFKANLAPGRYHVTVKLLDGDSDDTSQLIEKQVGLLSFDMLPGTASFLGTVDLGLRAFGGEKAGVATVEKA